VRVAKAFVACVPPAELASARVGNGDRASDEVLELTFLRSGGGRLPETVSATNGAVFCGKWEMVTLSRSAGP